MNTSRINKHAAGTKPADASGIAVRFELPFLPAKEAFLAGTFNDWHPAMFPMIEVPGGWAKELILPAGTYEYLFVVDGRWITDPANDRRTPNPYGGHNSVIEVRPAKPPTKEAP